MDINALTISHTNPCNQPQFDLEAFERAQLRREATRAQLRALWAARAAPLLAILHGLKSLSAMVSQAERR